MGGDDVGGIAGVDRPEHELHVRSGSIESPRRRVPASSFTISRRERDEVDGEFGTCGVSTRPDDPDHGHVGSRRDRARLEPDRADIEFGLAVQPDDRADAVEPAVADHVERTAGHSFLGRLEHEADRSGQVVAVMGEVQRRAQHDRGVDVVPAGVRRRQDARLAYETSLSSVIASASRSARSASSVLGPAVAVRRNEIAHETGSDGEPTRFEPGQAESFLDQLGGRMLGAAELGMGVEVASQRDETFAVFVEPSRRSAERRRWSSTWSSSAVRLSTRRWTTSTSVPPASTTRSLTLALVPTSSRREEVVELGRRAELAAPSGRRSSTSSVDEVAYRSPIGVPGVGVLDDQVGVDAVAGCEPAVLADRPLAGRLGSVPSSMRALHQVTSVCASPASATAPRTVGVASHIRNSTVPKSGCGRMSHHTSRMERMHLESISVDMKRLEVGPVGELRRKPGGGQPLEDLRSVPRPVPSRRRSKYGLDDDRASNSGRWRRNSLMIGSPCAVADTDVDVHAADQQATGGPLDRSTRSR